MTALCPHCGAPATVEHLRGNPECSAAAGRIAGVYAVSKRKDDVRTGKRTRSIVWKTCEHCGVTMTSRQHWLHSCAQKLAASYDRARARVDRKKPES